MTLIICDTDGSTGGADPRAISSEDLRDAGHDNSPLLQVIRAECLDCSGDQPSEVRLCTATRCPLWPYRMGTNPFTKPRGPGRRFVRREFRQDGGKIPAAVQADVGLSHKH